jgi:hypothetical protein
LPKANQSRKIEKPQMDYYFLTLNLKLFTKGIFQSSSYLGKHSLIEQKKHFVTVQNNLKLGFKNV